MTPRYVHSNSTLLVLLLMTTINPSVLQARQFAGGIGTQADPYEVATASQLDSIRYFASAHFRQTDDIDLNVSPYNIGHGWNPIPNFRGSYDGDGYTISNLHISRAATDTVGLFASINGASLTNLILSNPSVNGNNVVGTLAGTFSANATMVSRVRVTGGSVWGNSFLGGLVGSNEGVISESAATGMSISGTHGGVGGLAGSASGSGNSISNSYAINELSGVFPGGLVGTLSGGTITNSYTASSGGQGLVSDHSGGSITTSFYNADSSFALTTNGTLLFTETMQQQASFFSWDFSSIWVIVDEGKTFPELRAFADLSQLFESGSGSKADPYLVKTDIELSRVRLFPSAHFKQTADISLKAYQSGKGWAPIPDFSGSYDGGGYTISGLVINRPTTDMVGLFADVTGAALTNLTLSRPSVIGKSHVGTLAGQVSSSTNKTSTVSKIRVTGGLLKGTSSLGGLIGSNQGAISLSAATGITIDGSGSVIGGLTGRTTGSGSSISNSYAINKLNGGRRLGALTSILSGGTITNSYTASSGATGLVNANYSGTITNSYFNSDSSASNSYGDSLTTARMSHYASFAGFDFTGTWYFDPADPAGFPLLRELTLTSTPAFSGGSGTQANPYLVATAADVATISLLPGAYYKQTADIDLGVDPYHTGLGWRPIQDLTGSYDGGGYAISNLVINRPASDTLGLFAKITGATVTKLSLSNPSVTGKNVVGALVGALNSSTSTVSQVQITGGSVHGTEWLGGLAGVSKGKISLSAATGMSVSGSGYLIGGLVGYAGGTGSSISNSYAINKMSSSASGSAPGGLVGFTNSTVITNSYTASSGGRGVVGSGGSTITNSYFNSDSTTSQVGGTPLTTALMSIYHEFAGFDFSATWYFDPADPDGFPLLRVLSPVSTPTFSGGSGTRGNPYLVATAADVANILLLPGAHYKQTADINLGVAPYDTTNRAPGWRPIPDFKGSYDGGGFTISNLVINRPASDTTGLFAKVKGGSISNLSLSGATVKGKKNVGVLAGLVSDNSSITRVSLSNLTVIGSDNTGGLAGQLASASTVTESYTSGGSVRGSGYGVIGGLVGYVNNATITSSYSSGIEIASGNSLGGLVGVTSDATISDCYTINRVIGNFGGGLFGVSLDGSVTNCYSASVVSGVNASGIVGSFNPNFPTTYSNTYFNIDFTSTSVVGVGLSTAQMQQETSFTGFDFTSTWIMFYGEEVFPSLQAIVGISKFAKGKGTQSDPFQIATVSELNKVRFFPKAHFKQTADINLDVPPYNSGEGWLPIPDFTGSYDGGGYTISNLVIDRPAADTVGLFAKVTGDTLANLTLSNPSVTGRNVVGALAGAVNSATTKVNRIRITGGSVSGTDRLGGLAGSNKGAISLSAATGMSVSGSGSIIGGLAGSTSGSGSSISNSYAINTLSSSTTGNFPGGLVGSLSSGTVTNSYTASSGGRGVVSSNSGTITNSYFNEDSSATSMNGTPLKTIPMHQQASFDGFDFDTIWIINEGKDFPRLQVFFDMGTLFAGGSGTRFDQYQVATANQLHYIRLIPAAHYLQTADIDLDVAPYNTGEGWLPIPNLWGSFDGSGYTISNLFIDRPASDSVGLFTKITGGTLDNVTLANPSVTGKDHVGALVGVLVRAAGLVIDSRVTGGVVQGNNIVGGLVGTSHGAIRVSAATGMTINGLGLVGGLAGEAIGLHNTIANSYAINKVNGSIFSAGLVGRVKGTTLTNSYSASTVTSSDAGGLVNLIWNSANISNSYYNSDSTDSFNSVGTALKTAQMRQQASFSGWNFDTIWYIDEGKDFPGLRVFFDVGILYAGGSGTREKPYRIATADQLNSVRLTRTAHFVQTADIDLGVAPYNSGEGWSPIHDFTGSYDGGGFTISNLVIKRPAADTVGLFSKLTGGILTNLTLSNPSVNGQDYVGALVGFTGTSKVSISNIGIKGGSVSGANFIGGMVGRGGGAITYSYATGMNVTGSVAVGGLVGIGSGINNSIAQSYAINNVQGENSVGGLVAISGTVTNSYSASKVTATLVGAAGLVSTDGGPINSLSIINSYYNSDSTATGLGNGTALTTPQMRQKASFDGFDFDTTWVMLNGGRAFPELRAFVDGAGLFAAGSGTQANPYQIATPDQLNNVRLFPSRHYRQAADIDLNVSPYNEGAGWLPIPRFTGSFDGDGFVISNLSMNQPSLTDVGLFGKLDGGFLKDLTIRNPSISGGSHTAALVGLASRCAIFRIRISGGIISSSGVGLGGLAGISSTCTISDIQVSNATIASKASTDVGGVVGAAINTSITQATVNNSASGGGEGSDVGGLAGELRDGSSVSEIAVTGGNIENGDHSGGLVGRMTTSFIINSYSNTAVSGMAASGGLVGTLSGGSINTSYSASVATGNNKAGLVSNNNGGTISNAFYNRDSTGTGNGNGVALDTDQMYQQAFFNDFDFGTIWFIDEGSRFPGFQERKEDELVLTGGEGWRMLTSPLHSHSIGRLFKDLWLQGFKGADKETGPSNLYVWDEAKQRWEVPADTGYTPGGGKGLLIYVFSDDNADGIPEGFPKRLEYSGSGFSGDHSIDLSYTSTGSRDSVGFNLVGNPYPTTIHWDAQGWTRTSMDHVVYVWSESAGSYLAWNGLTGGLKGGKIAPWQAFWVRATGTNPRITFSDAVKSAGGFLFKQANQPVREFPQLTLELEGNGLSSTSIVMFDEQAEMGKDSLDAYKLNSLNQDNYLLLGTSVNGQSTMDIQALPYAEDPGELELVIEGSNLNGEFNLSWAPAYLPEGWVAELVDTKIGETFSLADTASYAFSLNETKAAPKEKETSSEIGPPVSPITPVIKSKKGPSRFVIRFHLATSAETDPELPQTVELQQNYPNPFNPATTINYQLPEQSRVRLEVFDLLGRKVSTLVDNEQKTAGHYSVRFDARNLASGMYLYRLQAGNTTLTKKLTLIK